MKKALFLLTLCLSAIIAQADIKPTTIVDGQFAPDTQWYYMNIAAGRLNISYTKDGEKIKLGNSVIYTAEKDNNLWCVVSVGTGIYQIFNKAAGPTKALTSPTASGISSDGSNGGNSFPTVKALKTTGNTQKWKFSEGNAKVPNSYYLNVNGTTAAVLNNRGGYLSFWTTGKDEGSAVTFVTPEEHDNLQQPLKDCFAQTGAIFVFNDQQTVQYRIPAIAVTKSGTLVAVNDYRYCGGDIGNGRIDLHVSRSTDGGKSWTFPDLCRDKDGNPVTQGTGEGTIATSNEHRDCGFGDACIVGDRESERVLMMSVCGRTPFWSGRRAIPNSVARWYSEDGGVTWTPFQDITDHIYTQFDGTTPLGYIDSMFFGSGRIMQSSTTKVGKYYRLYAVLSGMHYISDNNKPVANWVMYSDDFGENWKILGDPMTPPIPSGADEPKCEELPDGSIIVTSRTGGGRNINIFSFTDIAQGEGFWDTHAKSTMLKASSNACNGETLVVPVVRKSDNHPCYLLMQSIPFGPSNRSNVGINYKELDGYADYGTVANVVKSWDGYYQVSTMSSAYSTMIMQNDHTMAFFYEEGTYGKDYCDVYKNLTIEQITSNKYSYQEDTGRAAAIAQMKAIVTQKVADAKAALNGPQKYIIPASSIQAVEDAVAVFEAEPTIENYVAVNAAIHQMKNSSSIKSLEDISNDKAYLLYNPAYTTYMVYAPNYHKTNVWAACMVGDAGHVLKNQNYGRDLEVESANTAWMIYTHEGKSYLYNIGAGKFVDVASTTTLTATAKSVNIATVGTGFSFNTTGGTQDYMCAAPQLDHPISVWTAGDSGSCWQLYEHPNVAADVAGCMTALGLDPSAIQSTTSAPAVASPLMDLQGRRLEGISRRGLYISRNKKIMK